MNDSEQMKRPAAALINREWYYAAKSALTSAELAQLLVKACDYVFTSDAPVRYDTMVETVFLMVKPALDSDIVKYNERCARNAANAKRKASGSEWVRVGASGTSGEQQQPQPQQQPQQQPQPLSHEETARENREKYLIFGYFWSQGSEDPLGESVAFWSYYEALGWKNNKGAAIINKLAAARMWRRQYATSEPVSCAQEWFRAFSAARSNDIQVFTCFRGARLEGSQWLITLRCSDDFAATFTETYKEPLIMLQRSLGGQPMEFIRQG